MTRKWQTGDTGFAKVENVEYVGKVVAVETAGLVLALPVAELDGSATGAVELPAEEGDTDVLVRFVRLAAEKVGRSRPLTWRNVHRFDAFPCDEAMREYLRGCEVEDASSAAEDVGGALRRLAAAAADATKGTDRPPSGRVRRALVCEEGQDDGGGADDEDDGIVGGELGLSQLQALLGKEAGGGAPGGQTQAPNGGAFVSKKAQATGGQAGPPPPPPTGPASSLDQYLAAAAAGVNSGGTVDKPSLDGLLQVMMLRELQRMAKQNSDDGEDGAVNTKKFDAIASAFNRVRNLRQSRLTDAPGIRRRFESQVMGELGIRHGQRWTYHDYWELLNFSRFKSIGRCAYLFTEVIEMAEAAENGGDTKAALDQIVATAIQALKALHQFKLDGGSWKNAWGLTLLEHDPYADLEFAGDASELGTLAGHQHAKEVLAARIAGTPLTTASGTTAAGAAKSVTFDVAEDAHAGDESGPKAAAARGKRNRGKNV